MGRPFSFTTITKLYAAARANSALVTARFKGAISLHLRRIIGRGASRAGPMLAP